MDTAHGGAIWWSRRSDAEPDAVASLAVRP